MRRRRQAKHPPADDTRLVERALAAYRRSGGETDWVHGYVQEIDERTWVVVRYRGACVAAYRVRSNGRLSRAHQWPEVIW